jgi:hypothetical protein
LLFFSVVVESPVRVVGAGPKVVEQRPKENEGVVANSPDYDTLNFAREQDVFATGDKEKQREGSLSLFLFIQNNLFFI